MLEKDILRIKNNPVYQELKSYYSRSTIFSALGIERNENRHSAFLCWLLDPKSDHQLGVEPLKKFLALYAATNEKIDTQLRAAFVTGRYDVENVEIGREVTLARFCDDSYAGLLLNEAQKRLDIWSELSVILPDSSESRRIAMVIENKIYSKESKMGDTYQTEVYHDCLSTYYEGQTLLEVFLTPDGEEAHCPDFIHLTYQQLLDDVLLPLTPLITSEHAGLFINDYIRNLGKPALDDDDNDKKVKTYSILATSQEERSRLQQMLETEGMKQVLEKALIAAYGVQAKNVVGKEAMEKNEQMSAYETVVLTEFWNDNTDILKAMLYNLDIFPEGDKNAVKNIFKENSRDTTKYVVEKKSGDKWVPADANFNKPLAKGRAACVFFAQWMAMHEGEFTLEQVREIFPLSINQYYNNLKWEFIDTLIYGSDSDSLMAEAINKAGQRIEIASDKWDFYPIKPGRLGRCGFGYLEDGNMAVMPKMWRKEDFQRLLEYIEAHQEIFCGLRIRQA